MRKRTFMDRKFSAGDANSNAYRDSWDRMFGNDSTPRALDQATSAAGEFAGGSETGTDGGPESGT